jgi:hypothetical protein
MVLESAMRALGDDYTEAKATEVCIMREFLISGDRLG